jgi:acyl-coenzyme A synthetase/AMP-(fatty) acid ligase
MKLPNITDVVAKGEKHPPVCQMVVAHVALTTAEPLPELRTQVRAVCLAKLTDYKVPAKIVPMDPETSRSARFKKLRKRAR